MRPPECARSNSRGVAAIEFALVFPVLLILFFVMVNLSQHITMNRRLAVTANLVTDLVTRNRTVQPSDLIDYFEAARLALRPAGTGSLAIDIYGYQRDATGSFVISRWKKFLTNGTGGTPVAATAASCTAPNTNNYKTLIKSSDIIVTVVCMNFNAPVPAYGTTQFFGPLTRMRHEVVMRPRLATSLECNPTTC